VRLAARRASGVELVVADDGVGIPEAERALVLERFVRGDPARSGDGSGLGLYICKTLVEANQGRIWMESTAGQGTSFHLAFPAANRSAGAPEAEAIVDPS
jgi:signal transduction histidine kinase